MIKEPYPKEFEPPGFFFIPFKATVTGDIDRYWAYIDDFPVRFYAPLMISFNGGKYFHLTKVPCGEAKLCACYKRDGDKFVLQGYHKPYKGKTRARLHGEED